MATCLFILLNSCLAFCNGDQVVSLPASSALDWLSLAALFFLGVSNVFPSSAAAAALDEL
jgi:hypothetical protein